MKTATVRQLRNRYMELLEWIEAGEEVAISRRGVVIARLVPETAHKSKRIDWKKSAAVRLDRYGLPVLSAEESAAILTESQGS